MRWFYNLKIAVKLITGFIAVAIVAGIIGIMGVINIRSINSEYTAMYQQNTVPLKYIEKVAVSFQRVRVNIFTLMATNTDSGTYTSKIEGYEKAIDENLEQYEKLISSEEEQMEFDAFQSKLNSYRQSMRACIELAVADRDQEAFVMSKGELGTLAVEVDEAIDKLYDANINQAAEKAKKNSNAANQSVILTIAFIVGGMALAVGIGLFISRTISKPVGKMLEAADKLALGDVNVNVVSESKDEIGDLMKAFGRMTANIREQAIAAEKIASGDLTIEVKVRSENDLLGRKLSQLVEQNNEVLGNISSAADQVAIGARQVSSSSQALSQGSMEQASSIEEITASIEEVASQTALNAANANQANDLASTAKDRAIQGNMQMKEMVKAMSDINDSSSSISKIIKVIDEIAFQTNILALNAAVEAARAGQHGKGFAVVAEEVRNLAARSADAAKETTAMIEGSIKKVEIGTKIANETAVALNEIVEGVAKAANLVSDIATASKDQATGIEQVNQAINLVAQVVQTNSATSEEGAAASEELSGQADMLKELVSKYKLRSGIASKNNSTALSPEIMKILEEISGKNNSHSSGEVMGEAAGAKLKSALDDRDFGKY